MCTIWLSHDGRLHCLQIIAWQSSGQAPPSHIQPRMWELRHLSSQALRAHAAHTPSQIQRGQLQIMLINNKAQAGRPETSRPGSHASVLAGAVDNQNEREDGLSNFEDKHRGHSPHQSKAAIRVRPMTAHVCAAGGGSPGILCFIVCDRQSHACKNKRCTQQLCRFITQPHCYIHCSSHAASACAMTTIIHMRGTACTTAACAGGAHNSL